MASILRAVPEFGEPVDDPSEDALFMLFEDIDAGRADWLIVDRLSDPSQQTYAQAKRLPDGGYQIEHREGAPERHFVATVPDMRSAHAFVTGWAFGLVGWDAGVPWEPLELS